MKRRPDLPFALRSPAARHLTSAAAEGAFRLPVCGTCGTVSWPPREICPACLSDDLVWQDVARGGEVLAETTLRHSMSDYYLQHLPRRVVSVKLDAGPVVLAHAASDAIADGGRVRVFARLDRAGEAVLGAVQEDATEEKLPMDDPNTEIAGKTVLITGANGGIGQALVDAFRRAEAGRIVAAVRNPATAPEGTEAITVDVTDLGSVAALAQSCDAIDILINNAGANFNAPLLEPDDPDWARTEMDVNYFGMLQMARAFAPQMKARKQGVIVNMLTIVSHVNLPLMGTYAASKAACLSLTQGIRAELMPWGVRVVGMFPGAVDTDMSSDFPPPKIAPRAVSNAVVAAITNGVEDAYVGSMAEDLHARLREDPKAVERDLAAFLPEPK